MSAEPSATIAGIDVGGTKIAAGYLDEAGRAVEVAVVRTVPGDGTANLASIATLLSHPALRAAKVVGVSMATTIDQGGLLRDPHNWFGWKGIDLQATLSADGRRHVVIADAEAGAVGEHRHGAARGTSRPLYVTVGTGLAHAFIQTGTPLSGAHGSAYFSGYTYPARCRWPTCAAANVERISSGTAIAEAYLGDARADARRVFLAAAEGDERASGVIEHAAWHLGVLIADLMLIYDPETVVVGGGLGSGDNGYLEQVIAVARQTIPVEHTRAIPIVRAQLGSASCWVGAISVASTDLGSREESTHHETEGAVLT